MTTKDYSSIMPKRTYIDESLESVSPLFVAGGVMNGGKAGIVISATAHHKFSGLNMEPRTSSNVAEGWIYMHRAFCYGVSVYHLTSLREIEMQFQSL
jgi:hypothetical protein